jgi:phosphatidylglycerol---prolipoprotein diacylglyceryl transferase
VGASTPVDPGGAGLLTTHWFDPGADGPAFDAAIRFSGRLSTLRGKGQPGTAFERTERIQRVVPGSGPVSVTTVVYDLQPGEWNVTAELERDPGPRGRTAPRRPSGQTLPRASWSWPRWRLASAPFQPLETRWAPLVRLSSVPAVIHGSWTALVGLGIVIGTLVQIALLAREDVAAGTVLLVTAIGVAAGIAGAKLWYIVLRPRDWRRSLGEGFSVDGSLVAAPLAAVVAALVLGLPLGAYLDAGAAGFFVGVAIGRLGCFFTGCCAGRMTASRWGIWSSDRRVGARRIPTQLLEAGVGLLIAVVLVAGVLANVPPIDGVIFVAGLAAYLPARQLLLRLRADPRRSSLSTQRMSP